MSNFTSAPLPTFNIDAFTTLFLSAALHSCIAGALYAAYAVLAWLYRFAVYQTTVVLEVTTDDFLQWRWVDHFITKHFQHKVRHWHAAEQTKLRAAATPTALRYTFENRVIRISVMDAPPPNNVFMYGGHNIGDATQRRKVVMWTRRVDAAFFERFLAMLKQRFVLSQAETVSVETPSSNGGGGGNNHLHWASYRTIRRRNMDTLTMHAGVLETVLADIDHFLLPTTRAFYTRHGIPYRRGLLLEGPPGNGKSSFIVALASKLGASIRKLSLSGGKVDDMGLFELMLGMPVDDPPCLLVLEDVDCLFGARERESQHMATIPVDDKDSTAPQCRVTLSGLLNALDGVGAAENAIVIMTTNFVNRLDPALIRPGRIDRTLRFDPPDDARIMGHYAKFFPGATEYAFESFVAHCRKTRGGKECSMSAVQEEILRRVEGEKRTVGVGNALVRC